MTRMTKRPDFKSFKERMLKNEKVKAEYEAFSEGFYGHMEITDNSTGKTDIVTFAASTLEELKKEMIMSFDCYAEMGNSNNQVDPS